MNRVRISCFAKKQYYLFDQVGAFLAFLRPGFFLSLTRESLASIPYGLSINLRSGLDSVRAFANHSLIALD